jgi:hypothetical protein
MGSVLCHGGVHTLQSLKTYQLSGSKNSREEAEYVLFKAIESLVGIFNAEHGRFELNHNEGIDMLDIGT